MENNNTYIDKRKTYYFDDRHMCKTETRLKFKLHFTDSKTGEKKRCVVPSNYYFVQQSFGIVRHKMENLGGKFVKLVVEDYINNKTMSFDTLPSSGGHLEALLFEQIGVEP